MHFSTAWMKRLKIGSCAPGDPKTVDKYAKTVDNLGEVWITGGEKPLKVCIKSSHFFSFMLK